MSKTLIPNKGQVILSKVEEKQTSSGLILTGSNLTENKGLVVAVGEFPIENGTVIVYDNIRVDSIVHYARNSATSIKLAGCDKEYLVVPFSAILAVEIDSDEE